MDDATREKWNRAASAYDRLAARSAEKRWSDYKHKFFSRMSGRILFLAVGTGLDIAFFPPGRQITGIDISDKMLAKAAPRVEAYEGSLELRQMDVHDMDFADGEFDQIYTSCTFCSVPHPVEGLSGLRHVLRPGGELRMFEHTGSRWFPFNFMLQVMNPFARKVGPEVIRPTVENVREAGFEVRRVENLYLDVLKTIEAVRPAPSKTPGG